jgi:hypothetical protein
MSRTADRIARVQRRLDDLDRVLLIVLAPPGGLVGAIGGTVKARAQAIAEWYAEHADLEPTKAHVAEMKAGGVAWRRVRRSSVRTPTGKRPKTRVR